MESVRMKSKLAIGIILIILAALSFSISCLAFTYNTEFDWHTNSVSKTSSYGHGKIISTESINTCFGTLLFILFILFLSVGIVFLVEYTTYKKEIDKQKMEKMIAEKYGVQVSIPASKTQIVNCNNCNAEIECYENQPIITCSKCGKAYKNPYYKEK